MTDFRNFLTAICNNEFVYCDKLVGVLYNILLTYFSDYYREVLLKEKLLPCIKEISGDNYIFQQDSAPAQRARDTIAFLRRETPDFISPDQWPPNSPDMNPVDYKIWAVMQERVYEKRVNDVDELCQRLLSVWHSIGQNVIDGAIDQWRARLTACVRAKGGHFEHLI